MALIPPDAGIRMRMQTEANLLQQIAPVRGIPADLPDLQPGQRFSARIQEVLPENTYKALVAGKQLTLQLPEGAKAGDELELVVVDRMPKAIVAKLATPAASLAGAADAAGAYPFARFSPAARMIGQLLPADSGKPPPVPLNRGEPLLAAAPDTRGATAQLAPALAKAVALSGMFYESHQAQWVAGKLPLDRLLQEPQGQRSAPTAFEQAAAERAARPTALSGAPADELPESAQKFGADGTARALSASQGGAAQATAATRQVPEELRPLVQQQLESAGTNRMVWHGEIWPRQTMEWQIERQEERDADGSEEEGLRWQTALSLATPRLGRVDALLQLNARGVRIALAAADGTSADDLREAAPRLGEALAAAGVELLSLQVRHTPEELPS